MRRTVLVTTNSLFVLCAALWTGAVFGVLVYVGPAALGALGSPGADLVDRVFGRVERAGTGLVVFLLAIGLFEALYRRHPEVKRILVVRLLVVLGGLLLTVYLAYPLASELAMERSSDLMGRYPVLRVQFHRLAWLQVLTGSVALILTSVAAYAGVGRSDPERS